MPIWGGRNEQIICYGAIPVIFVARVLEDNVGNFLSGRQGALVVLAEALGGSVSSSVILACP